MYKFLQNSNLVLVVLSGLITIVYVLSTLRIVVKSTLIKGGIQKEALRVRSILGICYAALFLYFNFQVMRSFGGTQYFFLEIVNRIATPSAWVFTLILLLGSCLAVAFVVNFSRAVFLLNSLEHGTFDTDINFGTHLDTNLKRLAEFVVRVGCALSFIGLERRLNAFISAPFDSPPNLLLGIGGWGALLYTCLYIWLWTNRKFGYSLSKFRKYFYKYFYICGFVVSLSYIILGMIGVTKVKLPFIWIGKTNVSYILAVLFLIPAFLCSVAMIIIVVIDCVRTSIQQLKDKPSIVKVIFTEITGCFK